MKTNLFSVALLALGLAVSLPATVRADSSTVWEAISEYKPAKAPVDAKALKPGDVMVKVCNACKHVTLVRLVSIGQGQVTLTGEKCASCGSTDTYMAVPTESKASK